MFAIKKVNPLYKLSWRDNHHTLYKTEHLKKRNGMLGGNKMQGHCTLLDSKNKKSNCSCSLEQNESQHISAHNFPKTSMVCCAKFYLLNFCCADLFE